MSSVSEWKKTIREAIDTAITEEKATVFKQDIMDLYKFFSDHNEEFLEFDRIKDKTSNRPDLHAFMLLDRLSPGTSRMIPVAHHDGIFLSVDVGSVAAVATDEQLIELIRCGIGYVNEFDCFFSSV